MVDLSAVLDDPPSTGLLFLVISFSCWLPPEAEVCVDADLVTEISEALAAGEINGALCGIVVTEGATAAGFEIGTDSTLGVCDVAHDHPKIATLNITSATSFNAFMRRDLLGGGCSNGA